MADIHESGTKRKNKTVHWHYRPISCLISSHNSGLFGLTRGDYVQANLLYTNYMVWILQAYFRILYEQLYTKEFLITAQHIQTTKKVLSLSLALPSKETIVVEMMDTCFWLLFSRFRNCDTLYSQKTHFFNPVILWALAHGILTLSCTEGCIQC